MAVLARKFAKPVGAMALCGRDAGLMLCGGILTLACFFSGANVYYRAIFLLPVIPGLFGLFRKTEGQSVQKYFGLGLFAAIGCLYADMFGFMGAKFLQLGLLLDPYSAPGRLAGIMILAVKEAVWWLEMTVLGGILIAALAHAQTVTQFLNFSPWRRRPAIAA